MRVAGIMSGTSLDGIDVAVIETGRRVQTLAHKTVPYPKAVREAILKVSNADCHTREISRLNFLLPELYANALGDWVSKYRIKLIGCHGQTIFHEPNGNPPNTLQIGDGSVLAERTGVPVVSDFRPRDIAAGGQGAPLVPFVDYRLFRHKNRGRIALNIGGIANITAIPANARPEEVIAFDTGPGNMLIDSLVRHFTNGKSTYDRDGNIAAKGNINKDLLKTLARNPYFKKPPPKTCGREQFGNLITKGVPFEDLVITATIHTASTIAWAIRDHVLPKMPVSELIASGGGVHNRQIMFHLAALLPELQVESSASYGIHPDAKEAIAFAILAHETWKKRPSNLPTATGATKSVVLGKLSS